MFVLLALITMLLFIGHANATEWQYYDHNYCLKFDGTDDYVSCSSVVYGGRTDALTIQLWVKPNQTIEIGSNTDYGHTLGAIMTCTATWVSSGSQSEGGWALYFDFSDGHLYFKYRPHSSIYVLSPITIGTNRDFWNSCSWYNIVVTYSSGSGLAIYVNDAIDKTTPPDGNPIRYDTSALQIGGYPSADYMFQGLIDEVRIWNVSRTPNEVGDCWDRVLNASECHNSRLVGYWRFDEGTGMQSEDFSLQGNNASIADKPYDPTWVIVPEFPSFLILPLFMTATLLAVIVYRRKRAAMRDR
jgi:hypothetical protein